MKKINQIVTSCALVVALSGCGNSQYGSARETVQGPAQYEGPHHILMFVDTGASGYTRGCLKTAYPDFISNQMQDLNQGDTVTIIAYSNAAGYYPASTAPGTLSEALNPIRDKIDSERREWAGLHKQFPDLSKSPKAYVRLDEALALGLKDRESWPSNDSVSLYWITDGGAGFHSLSHDPKKVTAETKSVKSAIDNGFAVLTHDSRVKDVTLYGLFEQANEQFPNGFYNKTIMDQWLHTWLKDAPNVRNLQLQTE